MSTQYITKETVLGLGIDLGDQDIDALLTHLNETLEERIGTEITDSLDDNQLQELLKIQESANDEEIGKWLETNVPDMKQIVQDEIDILLGEIAENSGAINETK